MNRALFPAARSGLCVALLAAFAGTASAQPEPIKIGATLSISGPAAFLGEPEQKTLELYVEKINAAGGVLGRKLQLVYYDDGGDAEKARTFAKRLIEQDKVDLLIGGTTTGTTMATVPLVEQAQIPFISLGGAVVIIDPVKKWVFKTPHTDRMACERIFLDMQARRIERIGFVSANGGFDKSMHAECVKSAPAYKVAIVADETYSDGDSDMTAQLSKIKATPGVQAVISTGYGQGGTIVIKNYKQLAVGVPLYLSHGAASRDFIKLSGDAAEGARLPAPALLIADELADNDVQKKVVVSYKKDYEGRYKQEVSTFGGYAYDGLMLAVDAIRRAGSTKKDAVRDALEATKGYVGASGVATMSAKDHLGLDASAFRILEVSKGSWSQVK